MKLEVISKNDDQRDRLLAALIKPLAPDVVPSQIFVLRTRKRLLLLGSAKPDKVRAA